MSLKKIKTIIKAWITYLLSKVGLVSQTKLEIAVERLVVCHSCDIREGSRCSKKKQGTNLITGKLVKGCNCPLSTLILVDEVKEGCNREAWKR